MKKISHTSVVAILIITLFSVVFPFPVASAQDECDESQEDVIDILTSVNRFVRIGQDWNLNDLEQVQESYDLIEETFALCPEHTDLANGHRLIVAYAAAAQISENSEDVRYFNGILSAIVDAFDEYPNQPSSCEDAAEELLNEIYASHADVYDLDELDTELSDDYTSLRCKANQELASAMWATLVQAYVTDDSDEHSTLLMAVEYIASAWFYTMQ